MIRYHIDYETYSEANLKNVGSYAYAEHPSTRILMFAIAREGEEPLVWDVDDSFGENDEAINLWKEAVKSGDPVYAHNYDFEIAITKYRAKGDLGVKPIPPKQWFCTAAMSRRAGGPSSLEDAGKFLGLTDQKDKAGKRLIQTFSVPNRDKRMTAQSEGEVTVMGQKISYRKAWCMFIEYCRQDVKTQVSIRQKLHLFDYFNQYDKPTSLFHVSQIHTAMSQEGVPVNIPALRNAAKLVKDYQKNLVAEFENLTGVLPSQNARVRAWLQERGFPFDNLQAQTIEGALKDLSWATEPEAAHAIQLYSLQSYAALKKIPTMIRATNSDSRVRGTLVLFGAIRTHRWSGKLIQPQNIKRPTIDGTDEAYKMIQRGCDADDLEMFWDKPLEAVASVIRHFIHDPEQEVIDVDYSNIEARVLVWLAGDKEKVEDYRNGVDAYKKMASKIFKIPVDKVTKPKRFIGKTAILGCGYQTSAPKFADMLTMFGYESPTEEVATWMEQNAELIKLWNAKLDARDIAACRTMTKKHAACRFMAGSKPFARMERKTVGAFLRFKLAIRCVKTYREANEPVVALWREIDSLAKKAVANPGESCKMKSGLVEFRRLTESHDMPFDMLAAKLPSGHYLIYPYPELKRGKKRYTDPETGETREWESDDLTYYGAIKGKAQWGRVNTHGGSLVENLCQSIAGDFLVNGLTRAHKKGFRTFLVVHDQALAYRDDAKGHTLEKYIKCLTNLPHWAEGFPLDAEGSYQPYYTKD